MDELLAYLIGKKHGGGAGGGGGESKKAFEVLVECRKLNEVAAQGTTSFETIVTGG